MRASSARTSRTAVWPEATGSSCSTTSTTSTTRASSAATSPRTWATRSYRLVEGDIRDRALVFRLFAEERFDAVLHLAARAGVRPSLTQPVLYEEVNCVGTWHLLEAAVAHGKPHFVFASSSSVYGINAKLPFSEEDPIDRPISPYATTKRAGELQVFNAHHLHGLSRRLPALLHRVRPAAAAGDGDRALHPQPRDGPADPLLRRRPVAARLHVHRRHRRRRRGGARSPERLRHREPRRRAPRDARRARAPPSRPRPASAPGSTGSPISRATCRSPTPPWRRPSACSGSGRGCPWRKGCRKIVDVVPGGRAVRSARRAEGASDEHLHGRHRIRRPRHGRLPGGLRDERRLRRQGRRQDRRAAAGRDADLRARPRRGRRAQRARRPPALHDGPEERHRGRAGDLHRRRHAAQARRLARPHVRRAGGRGDRAAHERLQGRRDEVHRADRDGPDDRADPQGEERPPPLLGRVQPRVPARGLGRRGLPAPRPRRHRRRRRARGRGPQGDLQPAVPDRDALPDHRRRLGRAHQVRLQRLPRREDLLHQRSGAALRAHGRRRPRRRQGDGPRPPHRLEVPPPRTGLRRLLLPEGHLRGGGPRAPARLHVSDHRGDDRASTPRRRRA